MMRQGGAKAAAVVGAAFVAGATVASVVHKLTSRAKSSSSSSSAAPAEAGKFSSINRDSSGARETRELPRGKHPIQLYSMATPNGQKVTILLEELGASYDAWFIDIMKGDQFTSGFVEINPNSKIPAMLDLSGPSDKPVRVFESGAILLYLAEKFDKFIPHDPVARAECLNWLFFQMGAAPYFGQFGHFFKYAPEKIEYGIQRYAMETRRLLDVLDKRLQTTPYLAGDEYTIADIAWFPWVRCLDAGYKAREELQLQQFEHVQQWVDRIKQRPAVIKGLVINNRDALKEYHS